MYKRNCICLHMPVSWYKIPITAQSARLKERHDLHAKFRTFLFAYSHMQLSEICFIIAFFLLTSSVVRSFKTDLQLLLKTLKLKRKKKENSCILMLFSLLTFTNIHVFRIIHMTVFIFIFQCYLLLDGKARASTQSAVRSHSQPAGYLLPPVSQRCKEEALEERWAEEISFVFLFLFFSSLKFLILFYFDTYLCISS